MKAWRSNVLGRYYLTRNFSPSKSESRGAGGGGGTRSSGVKMSNRTVIAYDLGSDHALWFGTPPDISVYIKTIKFYGVRLGFLRPVYGRNCK